jgi:diaminopimelate decarboxylase
LALNCKNIRLAGFHCHVGSQVFDSDTFLRSAEIMLEFIADIREKYGYLAEELDLGGGYGVRYTENDPEIDIAANIKEVAAHMKAYCQKLGIAMPDIRMEPGRSIVADAGLTVYTAGTVKRIPGYKNYVSVDGGMADNPRFALYGSPYTVLPVAAPVPQDAGRYSVVGRCCESGDIIQENVEMPRDIARGDLIACFTTGAYHYSMASNYNKVEKPAMVLVNNSLSDIIISRENLDNLIACASIPNRLRK